MKPVDIINGIPHPVAILDPQLRIETMNRAMQALTGYPLSEVDGVPVVHVLRPNLDEDSLRIMLEPETVNTRECNVIDSARRLLDVRLSLCPVNGTRDTMGSVLLMVEDRSFLQQLDRKVQVLGRASGGLIGNSRGMQEIYDLLPVLSHTDATVLITGETGTGKDLLAETIHQASKRSQHPFIKVNCGAIPESLLESELFGHKKGAFTGAHDDKPGMFRLAQGGTIYLTEIGDLPLLLQVKLLTVLDDREFFPLGSTKKVHVDVRVIAGTHRDLWEMVKEKTFREDLYFRLNVLRAHMPPLRERGNDIRLLIEHFLSEIGGGLKSARFTNDALTHLETYQYRGNIRELRNIVEFAVSMSKGGPIELRHLPPYILSPQPDRPAIPPAPAATEQPAAPTGYDPGLSWSEIEKKKILNALINNDGNRTEAAKDLGWGRSTLWRKIKHYGIG